MVLKFSDPRLMHRTVPSGVDIGAEYMFDYRTQDDSPITRFMHGKCVLITGVTGFLGSLFLEKCLRIGAERVYVLCRPKNGQTPQQRIEALLDEPIFVKITAQDPNFPGRVHVLDGDLKLPHLGLTNAVDMELCRRVQFVIHAAADQRVSRTLWHLVRSNVYGTRQLLRLCRRMSQLELFVHLSPAHAQAVAGRERVEERFYDCHVDPGVLQGVCDVVHRNQLQVLAERICWPWPDGVTLTRALSEELVRRNSARVPTTVVRPSMLIATSVDPIPGWCPSAFGLNGILTAIAFGYIRLRRIACTATADVICADFVVNSTLAIMWDVCKAKSSLYEIPQPKVFHLTSGAHNPIDASLLVDHLRHVGHDLATWKTLWYPFSCMLLADRQLKCLQIPLAMLPAAVMDWLQCRPQLFGERSMLQLFRRLESYAVHAGRFLRGPTVRATFENANVLAVYDRMTDFDRETRFPCDVRQLNWKQYIYEYALGARLYIMREPFETVRTAVGRRRRLRVFGLMGAAAMAAYVYGMRCLLVV